MKKLFLSLLLLIGCTYSIAQQSKSVEDIEKKFTKKVDKIKKNLANLKIVLKNIIIDLENKVSKEEMAQHINQELNKIKAGTTFEGEAQIEGVLSEVQNDIKKLNGTIKHFNTDLKEKISEKEFKDWQNKISEELKK